MHFLKEVIYKRSKVWKWLLLTVLPSAVPIGVSLIAALNREPLPSRFDDYMNMNDLIFMGLSITISNLSAWRQPLVESLKDAVVIGSMFCMVLLSVCLGLNYSQGGLSIPNRIFVLLLVLLLGAISYKITPTDVPSDQTKGKPDDVN